MFRPAFRSSVNLFRSTRSTVLKSQLTAYRYLSQESRNTIQKAINGSPVVLFMKGTPELPGCGFSRAVVQILDLHEVPAEKLTTYNVLLDDELRSGIKEFSEWPTIPQVYVNGEFIGGCDIVLSMHQSGELDTLLENNNIIPKTADEGAAQPASS